MRSIDRELVKKLVGDRRVEWRKHALERMLERGISRNDVKNTLLNGEIIEEYLLDKPFPSTLFCYISDSAIHVVASLDTKNKIVYIITAYKPDDKHFKSNYKERIK